MPDELPDRPASPDPFAHMNPRAAAIRLGLGVDAVYDLCRSGALPHRRLEPRGGRIAITEADLAAYFEAAKAPPKPPDHGPSSPSEPPARIRTPGICPGDDIDLDDLRARNRARKG